jgi:hypothetical protein
MSMPRSSGQGWRTRVALILGLAMTVVGGTGLLAEAAGASDGPTVTISAADACNGNASATFANLPADGAEVALFVDGQQAFSGIRPSGTYSYASILLVRDDKQHTLGAKATSTADGTTLASSEATYGPCVDNPTPTPTPTPTKSTPTPTPTPTHKPHPTPPPKPHPTPTHKPHPTPPPVSHHPKPHKAPVHHRTVKPKGGKSSGTENANNVVVHHSATSQHTSNTQQTQPASVAPPAGGTGDDGVIMSAGSAQAGTITVYSLVMVFGLLLVIGSVIARRRHHGAHE